MKKIAITKTLGLAIMIVAFSGCQKFLDINVDPNNPKDVPLNVALTQATTNVGFAAASDGWRWSELWSQHLASGGPANEHQMRLYDRYNLTTSETGNFYRINGYAGPLLDLENIINKSQASSPHYAGVAKVLKAYWMHILVDFFGDVPYSQAFLGASNTSPAYDASSAIYTSLDALLVSAVADLNAATSELSPGNDDLFYNGNRTRWTRLANTLRLRLALHYSEVAFATAQSRLTALLTTPPTGGFMTANADNFAIAFATTPTTNTNPISQYENGSRSDQLWPSTTLVNLMVANQDPRCKAFFTPDFANRDSTVLDFTPPKYSGVANGIPSSTTTFNTSRMGVYLRGDSTGRSTPAGRGVVYTFTDDRPVRLMTFAEYNFIVAEAMSRGLVPPATGGFADAQTALRAGIAASMAEAQATAANSNVFRRITAGEITTYQTGPRGTLSAPNGGTAADLQLIMEEKWIASYGIIGEPWTDWRRTGFPILNVVGGAVTGGLIIRVAPYPQQEIDANVNTPARSVLTAAATNRPFWDVRTTGQQ